MLNLNKMLMNSGNRLSLTSTRNENNMVKVNSFDLSQNISNNISYKSTSSAVTSFAPTSTSKRYGRSFKMALTVALAFLISSVAAQAQSTLLGFPGEEHANVGVFIKDLRSGEILVDHHSMNVLTPASITKCLTTASALLTVGNNFEFKTPVIAEGTIEDGILYGDLVIVASGDPTLESNEFKNNLGFVDSVLYHVRKHGIKNIKGIVKVQNSFPDQGPVMQWELEDIGYTYGAGWFGLNWKDNTYRLNVSTGATTPHVPGLKVEKIKRTTGPTEIFRGFDSNTVQVLSTNIGKKDFSILSTMPNPSAVLVYELTQALQRNDIPVGDESVKGRANSTQTTLYVHHSPFSSEIMRSLMFRSDNMMAEGMLRALAPGETLTKCLEAEKKLWSDKGLETKYTTLFDGSGLSRGDRFSPRFLAGVLQAMSKTEYAKEYASFFPKVGTEGTVKSFLAKSTHKGQIALKSGSMNGVHCYAGYRLDNNGNPTHTIVIMINGFYCPRADIRNSIERLFNRVFK